jgi:glycosyltransferase involved in cell wall biosynthesis
MDRQMTSSSRVSFFLSTLGYGGAQRVTINLASGLAERGYDIDLVVGRLEGESASEVSNSVRLVDLDIPSVPAVGIFAGIPRLRSYLESESPALLISGLTHTNVATVIAASMADVPTFVAPTEHLAFDYRSESSYKSRLLRHLARFTYPFADDVLAVSEGVAESVVKQTRVDRDQTTVLYNPVDIEYVEKKAAETVDHQWFRDTTIDPIVSVGRLEPQKDIQTLIDAFESVHDARPETRLVVVGKGSERAQLVELVQSRGLSDVVRFPGYVDNPFAYISGASVFVLSSHFEGLPTVLIEALACETPIIATDCPYGPSEILADGRYGRLTPVGDVDAMAAAIVDSLDGPNSPKQSLDRARDFSMSTSIERYEEYIQRVTGVSQNNLG